MVHNCKSVEEFNGAEDEDGYENIIGRFFTNSDLERAKQSHLFDKLRDVIKDMEDDGVGIWYMCTEDKKKLGGGKWLMFALFRCDTELTERLLNMLSFISRGHDVHFEDIEPNTSLSSTDITGDISSCPLF